MTPEQQELWVNIKNFEIDDPESAFTFTDRLVRENDWTMEFAVRSIAEYKKFIFLICLGENSLTPSDQVDQVWHLHLLYTRSYWIEMCRNTLGREIHHGPTKGGDQEKDKYHEQYAKTKEVYFSIFNEQAPEDIWPSSAIRFGELVHTRINRHRNWVVAKPLKRK